MLVVVSFVGLCLSRQKGVSSELVEGSFVVSQKMRGVDTFRAFFELGWSKAVKSWNESKFGISFVLEMH